MLTPPHLYEKGAKFPWACEFLPGFHQDFSKIAKSFTLLLAKDTPFIFSDECLEAFYMIKEALITSSIIQPPDWSLPFQIMCNAIDHAVGAVLV